MTVESPSRALLAPASATAVVESWPPAGTPGLPRPPLERPLAALRRYKWIVAGVLGFTIVAAAIVPRFVKPKYEARATIWITSETPVAGGAGPIRSRELLRSEAWVELLRSYRISDAVVRKMKLYLLPDKASDSAAFVGFDVADRFMPGKYELTVNPARKRWVLKLKDRFAVDSGAIGDSVGRRAGLRWIPSARELSPSAGERVIGFTVITPREASVELTKRMAPRLADRSNFLWIMLQDTSGAFAARTLNAWVNEYVSVAAALKGRNSVEFANILRGQLVYAESSLKNAEVALENFRVNAITLPSEDTPLAPGLETRDPVLRGFFMRKIEYDNLRNDRAALQQILENGRKGIAPYEAALLIPSVAQSSASEALRESFRNLYKTRAELTAAKQVYTDEFIAVKQLAASIQTLEQQTIPQLIEQVLAQLRVRELEVEQRIGGAAQELQKIPARTIEEMRLRRAVVVAEHLYTALKSRHAEAQLSAASATPDLMVLDSAVAPLKPTKSTAIRVALLVVAVGFGLAVGVALLLERLDGRLRYPEQATHELGLAIAGTVPRLPSNGVKPQSHEQVAQLLESFRTLRMYVVNATTSPIAVAVTSPSPGEGKSLIAANLAMSFAEAGRRTVLVDGDTRRGTLHRTFGIKPVRGLTDYLANTADLSSIVYPTSQSSLFMVPSGPRSRHSPELLTSQSLMRLVSELRSAYDVVVFDTPPLAAGIDGYAIATAARCMLVVLRVGQSERRMAAVKLAMADRLPIAILGAVLNGVELTGEYHYYGYARGYGLPDEVPAGQIA